MNSDESIPLSDKNNHEIGNIFHNNRGKNSRNQETKARSSLVISNRVYQSVEEANIKTQSFKENNSYEVLKLSRQEHGYLENLTHGETFKSDFLEK